MTFLYSETLLILFLCLRTCHLQRYLHFFLLLFGCLLVCFLCSHFGQDFQGHVELKWRATSARCSWSMAFILLQKFPSLPSLSLSSWKYVLFHQIKSLSPRLRWSCVVFSSSVSQYGMSLWSSVDYLCVLGYVLLGYGLFSLHGSLFCWGCSHRRGQGPLASAPRVVSSGRGVGHPGRTEEVGMLPPPRFSFGRVEGRTAFILLQVCGGVYQESHLFLGLSLLGEFLMTDLISLLMIVLFRFCISSWVSFGSLRMSRQPFSPWLSDLLAYSRLLYSLIMLFISVTLVVMSSFHFWF